MTIVYEVYPGQGISEYHTLIVHALLPKRLLLVEELGLSILRQYVFEVLFKQVCMPAAFYNRLQPLIQSSYQTVSAPLHHCTSCPIAIFLLE